jgi:hypothetical protein
MSAISYIKAAIRETEPLLKELSSLVLPPEGFASAETQEKLRGVEAKYRAVLEKTLARIKPKTAEHHADKITMYREVKQVLADKLEKVRDHILSFEQKYCHPEAPVEFFTQF